MVVIIAVLIGAYFSFRETVAQQAIQSRGFLPAQFHYGLADLREDTKGASDAVSDTVSGWIDDNWRSYLMYGRITRQTKGVGKSWEGDSFKFLTYAKK